MVGLVLALFALSPRLAAGQESRPPSVLLVTVDTFRGDFLGAWGSERVATPNLDALAARGVLFTRARSPVPLTLPAHASILTGLYPPQHGVRDNGMFQLADEHRTLAEVLRARGYETAAFVSSFVLDERFGLAQGFDVYDDNTQNAIDDLENLEAERAGAEALSAFQSWLVGLDTNARFFAWVHLYDPHAPYEPPEPFGSRYASDPYAGEVAYTDSIIGNILGAVDGRSVLVAVAGDHGEGLGEHEETTHSLLIYNSMLHVPMIIAGPGVPAARRVDSLVSIVDLAPTLLELLGVEERLEGGESLRSAIDGEREDRFAYSESLYGYHHFGWSPLYGLETATHRFIDAPSGELYDMSKDAGERENVIQRERSTSRELFRRLNALRDGWEKGTAGASREIDAEARARLESLGYVSASARPQASTDLADPKEEMATYQRIRRARFEKQQGDCPAVFAILEGVDASIPLVYETLGDCHMALEEWSRARAVFEKALADGIENPLVHLNLGIVSFRQGRLGEAEHELRVTLALDETNVTAHYQLGNVLRAARRDTDAIESYRRALAVNPSYVYAWNGLGMLLARVGRNNEALDAFREAVRQQSGHSLAHFNLAIQLERMELRKEALESYRHFLEVADETAFPTERARARRKVRELEK